MSASIKNMTYLKAAVKRLVTAEVQYSWKGALHPEDHAAIDKELREARAQYQRALLRLIVT